MKKYEVFRSEGGYRVAGEICNGGPVMKKSPWYATKKAATCVSSNMRRHDPACATQIENYYRR